MTTPCVALCLAAWAAVGADPAPAPQPFALEGGETIVFFGDSITQGGAYVEYVDAALRTRFPGKSFRIVNSGISSETISGTSEADHNPRRPYAHERFERDVAAHRPQVLVACFGMNDGNYHPFESERFKKYQAGVRLLIERAERGSTRVCFLTPPPFDPYRRNASDKEATEYGYKFPAVDYDLTLEAYSQWLVRLRDEGRVVADVHTASNAHLAARRKTRASFFLAGDAVHPNPTGHWLMAQTLLEAWRFPSKWIDLELSATAETTPDGRPATIEKSSGVFKFTATVPLPVPFDPQWDAESLKLERFEERFNQGKLKVTGLAASDYELLVGDKSIGRATSEELAAGVELTRFAAWPIFEASREVLKLVQERRRKIYQAWRKAIADPAVTDSSAAVQAAEESVADLDDRIRRLTGATTYGFTLTPVGRK